MMRRFTEQYFSSPACGAALALLLLGVVIARISMALSDWWRAYWQTLSASFVGMSIGILLLQFLLDLQHERLHGQLRKTREVSISHALQKCLSHLDGWIPRTIKPQLLHVPPLEVARARVDKLRELSLLLALEVHDLSYREQLEKFTSRAEDLCENIDLLVYSISSDDVEDYLLNARKRLLNAIDLFKKQAAEILSRVSSHAEFADLEADSAIEGAAIG